MRTTMDIPDPLFRRVKRAAAEQGVAMRDVVVQALMAQLDRPAVADYQFDWKVDQGPWNPDLPLDSREALEAYLGSRSADLDG